jgi:hypothetical protein
MTLLELAERCEMADGPDPYLDEAIADALFPAEPFVQLADAPEGTGFKAWRQNGVTQSALRYSASLDAAMTLVPEGAGFDLRKCVSALGIVSMYPRGFTKEVIEVRARTPALALCAAALKARAAECVPNTPEGDG